MVIAGNNTVNPIQYLQKAALSQTNLAVEFVHNSSKYSFYLKGNQLLYATNSILSNSILERHLKQISHQVPNIKSIWNKLNLKIDQEDTNSSKQKLKEEFNKIIWLAKNKYLNSEQLSLLGKKISQEIIESLLLIKKISRTQVKIYECKIPNICEHSLQEVIKDSQVNLTKWQEFMPEINSTYQRPYLTTGLTNTDNSSQIQLSTFNRDKLGKILKGFNFRELAALLNIDELTVAQRLYPLIQKKLIILREPKSPLEKLTKLTENSAKKAIAPPTKQEEKIPESILPVSKIEQTLKTYKIACIDDSLTVLNSIKEFLNQDNIFVYPINNAPKAMMLMNRIKPDLIFMDISMPLIDGYQLCSLLRKNAIFKNIPIIMLTSNTGIINRAKAKMSGATDYMNKPFTQDDLLEIAFRYLSGN